VAILGEVKVDDGNGGSKELARLLGEAPDDAAVLGEAVNEEQSLGGPTDLGARKPF
jgi:hypothetical protein